VKVWLTTDGALDLTARWPPLATVDDDLAMPSRRRFRQVDVFGGVPYGGNPVAVVLDGESLTTEEMADFTRWTNLSEATFVLPPTHPDADYRVRIFTSASATAARRSGASELPFAGHPTLGTCHAWLEEGGMARNNDLVVQEGGAGLVPVRRSGDRFAFAAPPLIRSGPLDQELVSHVASLLRIDRGDIVDGVWADNGPGWVAVLLADAEAVLALEPGFVDLDLGVVGPYPPGSPAAFELRAFFPRGGATAEDPVTGSLNASVAQWLFESGRATTPYVASQGTALGRAGRIYISRDDDGTIWVGGATITSISGEVEL
jgi:PhzF family phenazine biosynthesis protein